MIKRLASGMAYFIEYDDKFAGAGNSYLSSIRFKSPALGTNEERVFNEALEVIYQEKDWQKAKEILERGGLHPVYTEK